MERISQNVSLRYCQILWKVIDGLNGLNKKNKIADIFFISLNNFFFHLNIRDCKKVNCNKEIVFNNKNQTNKTKQVIQNKTYKIIIRCVIQPEM